MIEGLTGFISGIISGTGTGGGIILILVLSMFMGVNQHTAQATNLIFFIPTSIMAILTTIKEKLVDWKTGIPVAMFGVIGAAIGAKISSNMEVNHLKKYFGIFLAFIAIFEISMMIKKYILDKFRHNNIKKI